MADHSDRSAVPRMGRAPARAPGLRRHDGLEARQEVQAEARHRELLNERPALAAQRKAVAQLAGRPAGPAPRKQTPPPNRTGLPDELKGRMETLGGVSLDSVTVHYGSPEPARLGAFAYAQGNDIHLAPGQERHLPHEAWHAVQQAQGRVRPTVQLKGGVAVNEDAALEREADEMGSICAPAPAESAALAKPARSGPTIQGRFFKKGAAAQISTSPSSSSPVDQKQGSGSGGAASTSSSSSSSPVGGVTLTAYPVAGQIEGILQPLSDVIAEAGTMPIAKKMPAQDLQRFVRKIAEGPDIYYDPPSLEEVLTPFSNTHQVVLAAIKGSPGAQWRKLNRIAGLMQQKRSGLVAPAGLEPIVAELDLAIRLVADDIVGQKQLGRSGELFKQALTTLALVEKAAADSRFMWKLFDIVSQFGPMAYALKVAQPAAGQAALPVDAVAALEGEIVARLRRIRQLMAKNPEGATVVAHRGSGPTNRTMGGLIQDDDNRRKNRPAENSPAAFLAAFAEVKPGGLDGIECDVFLSSDGVPMLSHERKVAEQLSRAQRALAPQMPDGTPIHLSEKTTVDELSSAQLSQVKRTVSPTSNFTTLAALLKNSSETARVYYEATGKAFRIEVEMKGATIKPRRGEPQPPSPAAVEAAVARVVSRFHKSHAGLPVEIVLFNGVADQVKGYAALRERKTALGATYTAVGLSADEIQTGQVQSAGQLGSPMTAYIDELRYQYSAEFNKGTVDATTLKFANQYLEDFIVTLVPGQEWAPDGLGLENRNPSMDLLGNVRGHGDLEFDLKIQKALERYAVNPANLEKVKKLHVLTDYPRKAKWIKDELVKASAAAKPKII